MSPDRLDRARYAVMARFDAADVRHYYDRHTAAFVTLGQGGGLGAIHRAVWGPGVSTREQAFRYVEDHIAALIRRLAPSFGAAHVVDLGCGVGGSLCYLADRLPVRGTGLTLSGVQQRLATERFREAQYSDRLRCVVGDYCALPPDVAHADLAFAIESFVHGAAPERFFAQCRELVRPGGLLVICDDFRRSAAGPASERTIERFRNGWRINTLLSAEELGALAREAGFEREDTIDLSPFVEIRRIRDRMASALLSLVAWLPLENTRLGYLSGGSALQKALAHGWIGYDVVVFRRLTRENESPR
jgi:SAM-dependent methyltransferase